MSSRSFGAASRLPLVESFAYDFRAWQHILMPEHAMMRLMNNLVLFTAASLAAEDPAQKGIMDSSTGIPVLLLLIVAVVFGAVIALIVARALRKEKRELKDGIVAAEGSATTDKGASQRFVKRCPTCKSVYTDESLAFCLSDGSTLERVPDASPADDPNATLLYREGNATLPPTVQYQPGPRSGGKE